MKLKNNIKIKKQKVKKHKAQAALEYIQTYAWALLAIIVILAVLILLTQFINFPVHCLFDGPGMTCSEPLPVITKDAYLLAKVSNNFNEKIIIKGVLCVDKIPKTLSYDDPRVQVFTKELNPGQAFILSDYKVLCYSDDTTVTPENKFNGHFYVWYNYKSDSDDSPPRFYHARFSVEVMGNLDEVVTPANGQGTDNGDDSNNGSGTAGGADNNGEDHNGHNNGDNGGSSKPFCNGNNVCEPELGETILDCAVDCWCNHDGVCDELHETVETCYDDCHCGDLSCDPLKGETYLTCASDCTKPGGMPDPASEYCIELGYVYYSEYCIFTSIPNANDEASLFDNMELGIDYCNAWDFFRAKCGQQYSYCEINSYNLEYRQEDMGSFNVEYGVCIFDDSSECMEQEYFHGTCLPYQCAHWIMSQGGCIN